MSNVLWLSSKLLSCIHTSSRVAYLEMNSASFSMDSSRAHHASLSFIRRNLIVLMPREQSASSISSPSPVSAPQLLKFRKLRGGPFLRIEIDILARAWRAYCDVSAMPPMSSFCKLPVRWDSLSNTVSSSSISLGKPVKVRLSRPSVAQIAYTEKSRRELSVADAHCRRIMYISVTALSSSLVQ